MTGAKTGCKKRSENVRKVNKKISSFGQHGNYGLKRFEIFGSITSMRLQIVQNAAKDLAMSNNLFSVEFVWSILRYSNFSSLGVAKRT